MDVLQMFEQFVDLVLRTPGLEVGGFELVMKGGGRGGVPRLHLQWRGCQGQASAEGRGFEGVAGGVLDEFVVPALVGGLGRRGDVRHANHP
ncbi:hypothetical protein D3C87_1750990 [compost metagenome]